MIFVTVGTHEQQFNRLIEGIDRLKGENIITDDVYIQTGYSTYEPQYCHWKKLFSFYEMNEMYEKADIIITHGGPASFMKALELKKIPIVVPRQQKFDEHVNDHQMEFVKLVEKRFNNIMGVYEIEKLESMLANYKNNIVSKENYNFSNNKLFNRKLNNLFDKLVKK